MTATTSAAKISAGLEATACMEATIWKMVETTAAKAARMADKQV